MADLPPCEVCGGASVVWMVDSKEVAGAEWVQSFPVGPPHTYCAQHLRPMIRWTEDGITLDWATPICPRLCCAEVEEPK